MTTNSTLKNFLANVKPSQTLWALQDKDSEDWVVLDSITFENTEVMPLWSNAELAQQHCIDEWDNYTPCKISLPDWFEFWLEDLNQDNVIVGVDWQVEQSAEQKDKMDDEEYLEIELADFTQALAEIESLK